MANGKAQMAKKIQIANGKNQNGYFRTHLPFEFCNLSFFCHLDIVICH